MILFFYMTENVRYTAEELDGFKYDHDFQKVQDLNQVSPNEIYFTTPSDFQRHLDIIKTQLNLKKEGLAFVADPKRIANHPNFPKHIGFQTFEQSLKLLKGKSKIKIAIINAMSHAFGDHLIGMQAFDYWYRKISQYFDEVQVDLFQINPYRTFPITREWHPKFQQIYMLPNKLSALMQYDGFIDLGTLLLRKNFDTQPMIDFFLEALSIDPTEVPNEFKRNKYLVSPEIDLQIEKIFEKIRSKRRPILLFHHSTTTPLRDMPDAMARRMIKEITELTDFYVVSAVPLDYQNPRFLDISKYSMSFDHFAAIISKANAIISVDTSTYHLADIFDIPTVVIFTTIDPAYRIKYYPYVKGIMLESEDGQLYGRHKSAKVKETEAQEVAYLADKWNNLKTEDVLNALGSC